MATYCPRVPAGPGGGAILTILNVAFPFAPVSMDAVGGAEQVVALMDRGLARRGHRSLVIACEGSRVEGVLIATAAGHPQWRHAIETAVASGGIDVIHLHGLDFYRYLPASVPPVLATLHLPINFYPSEIFHLSRPGIWLNCVSDFQRSTCAETGLLAGVVENGVRVVDLARAEGAAGDYVLALGRICPEKGYHHAVDAAERAGLPLWLAGQVFPYDSHKSYWRDELRPRLRPPHRYLGPVGFEEKARLLSGARCLLAPSTVAETSSLVAMEAISCGCPVIAFPSGALPEIVDHGVTGYIVPGVLEMAEAIGAAAALNRRECRRVARRRFDADRMIARYLALYDRLCAAKTDRSTGLTAVAR